MNINQKKILAASSLGALRLVFSLLGAAVPGLMGIPGSSGVINILWAGGFLALPPLITRAFGSSLISGTVYGILALPLPLSGPSGFLPKVLIGASTGLVADLVYGLRIKNDLVSAVLMAAAAQTLLGVEFAFLGRIFQLPGIDKYFAAQFSAGGMGVTVLGGGFSGLLGWLVYKRIETSGVVRRVRS